MTRIELSSRRDTQGFTLLEVLVAIALLGLLIAALTGTLTGALGINRQSQTQLDTSTRVQQVMESVRNAWSDSTQYARACVPGLQVPSGYTVKFTNLSSRAQPITQANALATTTSPAPANTVSTASPCAASTNATLSSGDVPVMRRVVVQSGTARTSGSTTTESVGDQDVNLTLDILGPQ